MGSCYNIPVSLSDFEYCSNGTCYFSQQVALSIPAAPGSTSCLQLVSPDATSDPIDVAFTVSDSYFYYTPDYIYHTDDPRIDIKTFCSCPSGSSATCPSCGPSDPVGDAFICLSGTHTASDCPGSWFGQLGRWCAKWGFNGENRFRIYKFLPNPTFNMNIQAVISDPVTNTSTEYLYNYQGNPVFYANTTVPINVTLVSSTVTPIISNVDYALIDMVRQWDFYVLESDAVNSQDTYDSTKIGWFKSSTDHLIDAASLASRAEAFFPKNTSCNNDYVYTNTNFLSTTDYLNNHQNKLASYRMPNSLLIDNDMKINPSEKNFTINHNIEPYYYLNEGWIFMDQYGITHFLGVDANGQLVPIVDKQVTSSSIGWNMLILTQDGIQNVTGSAWRQTMVFQLYQDTSTDPASTDYVNIYFMTNGSVYGLCTQTAHYTVGGISQTVNCINITFTALDFPSMQRSLFYFDGEFRKSPLPVAKILTPGIYSMSSNGVINLLIEFRNFTVRFDSTSVKPVITGFSSSSTGWFTLTAQSVTVGGTCFISSDPAGLIIAQPISLGVTPLNYNMTFNANKYSGPVTIDLRCYKADTRQTYIVDFDITPPPINITNPDVESDNGGPLIKKFDNAAKTLWDALKDLWSPSASILDRFMSILWWVILIACCIVAIIILYYLIRFIIKVWCFMSKNLNFKFWKGKGYKPIIKLE